MRLALCGSEARYQGHLAGQCSFERMNTLYMWSELFKQTLTTLRTHKEVPGLSRQKHPPGNLIPSLDGGPCHSTIQLHAQSSFRMGPPIGETFPGHGSVNSQHKQNHSNYLLQFLDFIFQCINCVNKAPAKKKKLCKKSKTKLKQNELKCSKTATTWELL